MEQTHKHYRGLSDAEVSESRRLHGDNILTPPEREPLWRQFLKKFTDPIIVILLVALALSVAVAFYQYFVLLHDSDVFLEPAGILASVILATVVGFCFEVSAERKFEILNKVDDDTPVKVIRNGNISQIAKHEVVVGDIIVLGTGEEIPADGLLLDSVSMNVDESTLTGEPMAYKSVDPDERDAEATYPTDHVMRGTTVVDGHGTMRVTAVGDATEYGKVYEGARIDSSVETPLVVQLRRLAGMITKGSYAVAVLIVVGRLATYLHADVGFEWLDLGNYLLSTAMIAITVSCGGCAGGSAHERHFVAGVEYEEDVVGEQSRPQDARVRNHGSRYGYMYRQDRYPHAQSDAHTRHVLLLALRRSYKRRLRRKLHGFSRPLRSGGTQGSRQSHRGGFIAVVA